MSDTWSLIKKPCKEALDDRSFDRCVHLAWNRKFLCPSHQSNQPNSEHESKRNLKAALRCLVYLSAGLRNFQDINDFIYLQHTSNTNTRNCKLNTKHATALFALHQPQQCREIEFPNGEYGLIIVHTLLMQCSEGQNVKEIEELLIPSIDINRKGWPLDTAVLMASGDDWRNSISMLKLLLKTGTITLTDSSSNIRTIINPVSSKYKFKLIFIQWS